MKDLPRIRPTADLSPAERVMFVGVPKSGIPLDHVRAATLDRTLARAMDRLRPPLQIVKRAI